MGGGSRQFGSRRGHGCGQQVKKIKLLMLGDSGVGKSSLMDRFTEDYFNVTKVRAVDAWVDRGVVYVLDWMHGGVEIIITRESEDTTSAKA